MASFQLSSFTVLLRAEPLLCQCKWGVFAGLAVFTQAIQTSCRSWSPLVLFCLQQGTVQHNEQRTSKQNYLLVAEGSVSLDDWPSKTDKNVKSNACLFFWCHNLICHDCNAPLVVKYGTVWVGWRRRCTVSTELVQTVLEQSVCGSLTVQQLQVALAVQALLHLSFACSGFASSCILEVRHGYRLVEGLEGSLGHSL